MMTDRVKNTRFLIGAAAMLAVITGASLPWLVPGGANVSKLPGVQVAAAVRGEYIVVEPIRLSAAPSIVIERGTLRLDRKGHTGFRSPEDPAAVLASGRARLVLEGGRLTVDPSPGAAGSSFAAASAAKIANPIVDVLAQLGLENLSIRNAAIVVKRAASDEGFENVDAEIALARDGSARIGGKARLRGEALDFDLTLGVLKARGNSRSIAAKVNGALFTASLYGSLETAGAIAISGGEGVLNVPDVRAAARWLGAGWPSSGGLKDFSAEGPVQWSDGRLSFESASFSADGNRAAGNLSLSLTAGRPFVEGTLAFDHLEVAPYVVTGTGIIERTWASLLPGGGSASQSLIEETDADLRVSAVRVTLNGTPIGRGAVSISIKDRTLAAEFAEVVLTAGGTGTGRAVIEMRGGSPRVHLKGQLIDLEIGTVAAAMFGHAVVEGIGTVDADLSGEGATSDEIAATATGTLNVDLPAGGRIAANMQNLAAMAAEAGGTAPSAGRGERASDGWGTIALGSTPVDNLTARFAVKNGTLEAKRLDIEQNGQQASATGIIALNAGELDVVLKLPSFAQAILPRGGYKSRPAEANLFIKGPWASPSIGTGTKKAADAGDGGTPPVPAAGASSAP